MIILILIDIIIMIYIYLKYYYISNNEEITEEKIEELDSIYLGYISDKEINNNFDLILAEIINLNIKGHIIIEYDKNDITQSNYVIKQNLNIEKFSLKNYEIFILDFLFAGKTEISKKELEEKLSNTFNSYNLQYNRIEEIVQEDLEKSLIIDKQKDIQLKRLAKAYKKISILLIAIILILKTFVYKEIPNLYIYAYIIEKLIIKILLNYASIYTNKGKQLKRNIDRYKYEIYNTEFLENKKKMEQVVLEKKFADTLVFHINTDAKELFINNQIQKNANKEVNKLVIKVIRILVIFFVIGIVLSNITKSLTKEGIFWIYAILIIIIAIFTDVTKLLASSKRRKF